LIFQNSVLNKKQIFPISIINLCDLLNLNYSICNLDRSTLISSIIVSNNASVERGCLFIPYDETDQEIVKKVNEGAVAVLLDHEINNIPCVIVDDLPSALYLIGRWLYKNIALPSVAVIGSVGKTTTKRMVYNILKTEKRVYCKLGNFNTLQALNVNLQEIDYNTELIIQEVDEKRRNNTVYCSKILHPKLVIVTNVAESHIGFYGSKEALIESFRGITAGMEENSVIILNADDEDSLRAGFNAKIISVGIYNKTADYIATNIVTTKEKTEFDVISNNEKVHIIIKTHGEHNIYNAMMAFIVGKLEGLSVSNIKKGLLNYNNTGVRQNICQVGNVLLYADCYNSSLRSVKYALKTFCDLPVTTRNSKRVAIIGDIGEIEGYEDFTYNSIANLVDKTNIDILVTCGKASEQIIKKLTNPNIITKHTNNLKELNQFLKDIKKQSSNSYLFKASRFMQLEKSIKAVFPFHYYKILFEDRFLK